MTKPLTLSLGEVLWDMLPDGKVLGGAPTNVAWHAAQLGADARVVSAVGDDPLGHEIVERLKAMHLDITNLAVLSDAKTSTVDARLDEKGNATYVIHEDVAWDHLPVTNEILDIAAQAKAINFGSLAQRHETGRATTHAILDVVQPDAVKIFDINLRAPYINREILDAGMLRATVVKMNHDELPAISAMFSWTCTAEDSMKQLLEAYPNVQHLVVTKADQGAWWQTREHLYFETPPKPVKMCDTIGAGDSVTASVMMGLLNGWSEPDILKAAMKIASFVCSSRGGTPELPAELQAPFLNTSIKR